MLPQKSRPLRICAHHGNIENENVLQDARLLLREQPEIDMMEIDFVAVGGDYISAHDYSEELVGRGSTLSEWVHFLCVEQRRILYVDLKAQLNALTIFCSGHVVLKFDCEAFYLTLNNLRKRLQRTHQFDIRPFIWLSCQEQEVKAELKRLNYNQCWRIITDIPYVSQYIWRYVLPSLLQPALDYYIYEHFLDYDFSEGEVISIDRSFFSERGLRELVETSRIPLGSTLILYAYERSHEPIHIEHYHVIMLYDYHL